MMEWGLSELFLSAILLGLSHLPPTSCGTTVSGCDGHPCSTGDPTRDFFTNEQAAITFSRCHSACVESVSNKV